MKISPQRRAEIRNGAPARLEELTPGIDKPNPLHLSPAEEKVREHWEMFRPRMYRDLVKRGALVQSIRERLDLWAESMAQCLRSGLDYHQAEELANPIILLRDEEDVPGGCWGDSAQ